LDNLNCCVYRLNAQLIWAVLGLRSRGKFT
jgi:hypothetical protein